MNKCEGREKQNHRTRFGVGQTTKTSSFKEKFINLSRVLISERRFINKGRGEDEQEKEKCIYKYTNSL